MNILMIGIIAILVCGIGILFYLAYKFNRDKSAKQKPPSEPIEAPDVNQRISAARRRLSAATVRSEKWRELAAQHRVDAAESRVLDLTKKDIQRQIWRFLRRPTTAAWTALFYILISSIGVTYSGAFYLRFEGVHILDFFGTSDFLLSAFQSVKMLVVGVSGAVICIIILLHHIYNFSIYSVYKGERKGQEREERIKLEAAFLLSIIGLFILLVILLWWYSPHLWWSWSEHPNLLFYSISLGIFGLLCCSVFMLFRSLIRSEQGAQIKWQAAFFPSILLFLFPISLLLWDWSEHFISLNMNILYLISFAILVPVAYCFARIFRRPRENEPEARITWGGRFLVVILLVESTFILPFLSGMDDSKAALNGESPRLAKVTLRQDIPPPKIPLPDLALFLGTTSGFHFFYECEKAPKNENGLGETTNGTSSLQGQKTIQEKENNSECQKSRPFIIPTANVSVLKFFDAPPHVGLPAVVATTAKLAMIINALKSETVEVISAIIQINTIIDLINRNSEIRTKLIIPKIETPTPESIAHLGPDQIATAIVAFQSYLEGKTPITHLNETITTLNEAIKALNQADEPDPDLANIAEEIKGLNSLTVKTPDLDGIPDAIKGLNPLTVNPLTVNPLEVNPLEVKTPDLKGIPDAIKGLQPEIQNHCAQGWKEVATLWPFPKENHELFGGKEERKKREEKQERLARLIQKMRDHFDDNHILQQLILIGRVDKTRLRWGKRHFYGSNEGLAQARAKWLLDEMKARLPEQAGNLEQATILLSAGPLHVGQEVSDDEREKDRTVEVYACWTPKDSE